MRPAITLALLAFAATTATVRADPLRIFAAGSLSGVVGELVTAAGLPAAAVAPPVFGPAGLLRQRIEDGEAADLFASADLAQPQHLMVAHPGASVVPFARNRTCALGAASLGLDRGTLLDRMLDPAVRIATSTPGSDPGGDYAQAVFARAELLHRGAQAVLQAKAQALFGGPTTMVPTNGHTPGGAILLANRADLLLYYCSNAPAILAEVPGAVAIPLPPELEPGPVYGLAVLGSNPDASKLALFMLSGDGQAILARHGLLPVLSATDGVTVLKAGSLPSPLSLADLHALPSTPAPVTREGVGKDGGEGGATAQFAGPTLWAVLRQAGVIDPNVHKRVDQVITVTGRDGYSVTVAMGEIDPEFENKPIVLATERNGTALDIPRLAIPGDKRPGRSVRDVTSIEVR